MRSRDKGAARLVLEAGGRRRYRREDAGGTGGPHFTCIPLHIFFGSKQ